MFENDDTKSIDGFLFLKVEDGLVGDVTPPLAPMTRIKVGTFKINAHGTKLGERFVKKSSITRWNPMLRNCMSQFFQSMRG